MNIFEVNGVWQVERPNEEHEKEHAAGNHPQTVIPQGSAMLT